MKPSEHSDNFRDARIRLGEWVKQNMCARVLSQTIRVRPDLQDCRSFKSDLIMHWLLH